MRMRSRLLLPLRALLLPALILAAVGVGVRAQQPPQSPPSGSLPSWPPYAPRWPGPLCVEVACRHLGGLACDGVDEMTEVARVCNANVNGSCLQIACSALGPFGCDSLDEIERVGRSCQGPYGAQCLAAACDLAGRLSCDEPDEVLGVAGACAGNLDDACVRAACARLERGCDTLETVTQVARACAFAP